MDIETRLHELGIELPTPAAPVAAYVPFVEACGLLSVSGQLPFDKGALVKGRMGAGEIADVAIGTQAARLCGIMLLAQLKAAVQGDWGRVERIVKLGGFVSSTPDFTDQPKVINGASELMVAVFGERGKHSRSAVGVPCLPLGALVEVDMLVSLRT
jgi:enamine deaminase RidA (YjgF/YER057c/UK114 family)